MERSGLLHPNRTLSLHAHHDCAFEHVTNTSALLAVNGRRCRAVLTVSMVTSLLVALREAGFNSTAFARRTEAGGQTAVWPGSSAWRCGARTSLHYWSEVRARARSGSRPARIPCRTWTARSVARAELRPRCIAATVRSPHGWLPIRRRRKSGREAPVGRPLRRPWRIAFRRQVSDTAMGWPRRRACSATRIQRQRPHGVA